MAAKKPTPGTRSRRNRVQSPTAPAFNAGALREYIEEERGRLMDAEAALDCVIFAMKADDRMDAPGPGYANVIRIARSLLRTSIDQLDSVSIRSVIEQVRNYPDAAAEAQGRGEDTASKYEGVTESPTSYMH